MAQITLNREKLASNFKFLNTIFKENEVDWAIVSKLLCGNKLFLNELLKLPIKEICDSRLSNLRTIKDLRPDVQTVYIKPPSQDIIKDIVRYADVSFNSESETIKLLSDEAQRQGKEHRVIIMIELGDLREGIMGSDLIGFYKAIFELPHIKVAGIGTNLNCLNGVMPSQDKLIQLSLYKQLIEATFEVEIPWVTGGTSVTIPLLLNKQLPAAINHFRVGETLYFGLNLFTGKVFDGMYDNVLELEANIIELTEKPKVPIGTLAENPQGKLKEVNSDDYGKHSHRAILDIGLLDISPNYLIPINNDVEIMDASSDMLVVEVKSQDNYQVGDTMKFKLKYMGALGLLSSDYVKKKVI